MSREFLSSVVNALRFSARDPMSHADSSRQSRALCGYSAQEWARQIGALDRVGLTLPLYARLLEDGQCATIPGSVIAALERRRLDNALRMSGMLMRFDQATEAMRKAGARFVCVKGFTLFPEYLPELWQRHQIDFDYLIKAEDLPPARKALEEIGYRLTAASGEEWRLRIPLARPLTRNAYLYQPQEGSAVELHTEFWNSRDGDLSIRCRDDYFSRAEMHTIGTVSFPRLARPEAFLYQLLHLFRHFMGSWARLLWFYELAAFMHRHQDDGALWQAVSELLGEDARLREAAALVLLCARGQFGCAIPPPLEKVSRLSAASPVRRWIDGYSRRWLLTDMPGNKLNLLLHRHFITDGPAWRDHLSRRLAPIGNRPVLCEGIDRHVAKTLAYKAANFGFQASRLWHHLRSNFELALAGMAWHSGLHARQELLAASRLHRGGS